MSILKQLIEDGAVGGTGAGAVASVQGSLFGGGMVTPKKKKTKIIRRKVSNISEAYQFGRLAEALGLGADDTNFNPADVISKLDAAEKKAAADQDTVSFGMKDEEGNIVEVFVRADQADDFEHALSALLGQADENGDDLNSQKEIAEVLYELKSKFEIVNVKWGNIPTDEEEEQKIEGEDGLEGEGEAEMTADEQDPNAEGDMEGMDDLEGMDDMGGGAEDDMKSTLQQVIDMLKANAEAQTAEAKAKEAEAKAKEAEFAARAAEAKIKQEEEVLDMEAYYKDKKDQEKEAKRLAKLAKFKHDKARDADSSLSSRTAFESMEAPSVFDQPEEDEEEQKDPSHVTPRQLVDLIFKNLRAN